MYYTVTNGSAAFDTLQTPIPHITVYYIFIHKLITSVTLLHLITPQCPIASEFIRGTVAFYRYLTRITVSDIKSEWI